MYHDLLNLQCSKNASIMEKPTLLITVISSLLLLCSYSADAEIYKWIDEQGKVHFTDNPPSNKQAEEVKLKINTYSSVEIKPLVERLGKANKVVMYSAEWCGICKQAKQYFRKNNIAYVSYDVEKSRTGKIDFKLLGGKSIPVIIVGNKRMNGFNISKFDKLYKDQKKQNATEG